jgi:hypothetical protein
VWETLAAMTVPRSQLAVPVLALTLAGCAAPHSGAVRTPTAAPSPTAVATAPPSPLIAVLDHPFGATPNTLRLVRPDGAVVASVSIDPEAEAIAVAGRHVIIAGAGQLVEIDDQGTSVPLPTLPGSAQTDLVRGLVAAPDGVHWLWASVAQSDSGVDSRVYLGSSLASSAGPTMVVERRTSGTALQPLAWTTAGPVLSEEPLGIGGYVLFRRTFGATSLLDLATKAVRPLTGADCAFSDMSADGSVACVVDGREGPHGGGPVTLRLTRDGHAPVDVALPASVQQAGAAFFRPDGAALSLATSPALGEGKEQIETDLVDVATGARHAFGPVGVIPVGWLADGRLVVVRLPGVAGGAMGTYVVDSAGNATLVSTASTVIGVLD